MNSCDPLQNHVPVKNSSGIRRKKKEILRNPVRNSFLGPKNKFLKTGITNLASYRPLRLRRPLRSGCWTLSFGGEVEVAAMTATAMTATAMSSRWLQQKRAVDSTMRVGGGRRRRQ